MSYPSDRLHQKFVGASFMLVNSRTRTLGPTSDLIVSCFKIVMQNGPAYCEAFLNVLRNVTKEEAVQYVLALIDDMLSGMCTIAMLDVHE